MRVPATTAALCAGLLALGSRSGEGAAGAQTPIVILERGDDGARADGLVARRWAVLSDGTVLAAERDGSFGSARLEPDALAALLARVESARLSDLPPIVASRADWFDARDAWCTLSAAREGGVRVRIEGDLRPGSPDRALAPHGFVEVLEVLDAARPAPRAASGGIGRVEFHLVPWSARSASPHAPIEDPLPWPREAGEPAGGRVEAEGDVAAELLELARAGRAVRHGPGVWRLLARPLFPGEDDGRTAGGRQRALQSG